ncbi:unnamed protein product [Urochloa decumbens]|uniref:Hexosyltransferase n=1 Tax=Urochloa decumbens TaxID=240449 RepID=A0ABC8ZT16_9POAL
MDRSRMKLNPILIAVSAATLGFFIGVSFPLQMAPQLPCYVFPWSGSSDAGNSSTALRATNMLGSNNNNSNTEAAAAEGNKQSTDDPPVPVVVQPINASSQQVVAVVAAAKPTTGAERLPPKMVVSEADLHMRRLWGDPRQDTPARKYLLTMTVGYSEKANVNATIDKRGAVGRDAFPLRRSHCGVGRGVGVVHVGARKQSKWWYAKRFLHPSVVKPYDYVFLWDEDLDTSSDTFDAAEYVRLAGEEARNSSCPDRVLAGGVGVRVALLVQNDLVHGWGLDLNFWRCVEDPEQHMGVVDAPPSTSSLNRQGDPDTGGAGKVRARAWREFADFKARIRDADRAAAAALAAANNTTTRLSPPRSK